MKRIIASFFLIVFLFQVGGYYIIFLGIKHQAKHALLQRLDAENYSDSELVVLSIPLTLPYPVQEGDSYQRINGDFEYQGKSYKLVKQKLENDTLFVACIYDRQASKLESVFNDFTKFANDLPADSKKALNFLSKLYKDFKSTEFKTLYKSRIMYEQVYFAETSSAPLTKHQVIDSPPPEFLF